jgi:hypothetical protein
MTTMPWWVYFTSFVGGSALGVWISARGMRRFTAAAQIAPATWERWAPWVAGAICVIDLLVVLLLGQLAIVRQLNGLVIGMATLGAGVAQYVGLRRRDALVRGHLVCVHCHYIRDGRATGPCPECGRRGVGGRAPGAEIGAMSLNLRQARLEAMASGHVCLVLGQCDWQEFAAEAESLAALIGARVVDRMESVVMHIWRVEAPAVSGAEGDAPVALRIVWDDYPHAVTLESDSEAGDRLIRELRGRWAG